MPPFQFHCLFLVSNSIWIQVAPLHVIINQWIHKTSPEFSLYSKFGKLARLATYKPVLQSHCTTSFTSLSPFSHHHRWVCPKWKLFNLIVARIASLRCFYNFPTLFITPKPTTSIVGHCSILPVSRRSQTRWRRNFQYNLLRSSLVRCSWFSTAMKTCTQISSLHPTSLPVWIAPPSPSPATLAFNIDNDSELLKGIELVRRKFEWLRTILLNRC